MADAVTVFVCVTCRGSGGEDDRPGQLLFDALVRAAQGQDAPRVASVACLSVCKRPCTVALAAAGKWGYVVADLDPATHADDVIAMALRYGQTADGIIPWRERALCFRKGVVARVPPVALPAEPD